MKLWPTSEDRALPGRLIAAAGTAMALGRFDDIVLTCRGGCAWITQEGRHADTVLRTGESARLRRHGKTLVSALIDSELSLEHVAGGRP